MPWFPDIANPAFCETLHLRRIIAESQRPPSSRYLVLEPGSAEFISALAAGSNSRHILHVGCGLSTIALAAAARATGGFLACVEEDEGKLAIVGRYVEDLGLSDYVHFFLESPLEFIARSESFDFILFTGEPLHYIPNFDQLKFTQAAIIVAYNALDNATNEYIKHVRQQPGIDSSTLPVGRGIEVSKILSWDLFKAGRKPYCHCAFASNDEVSNTAYLSDQPSDAIQEKWEDRSVASLVGNGVFDERDSVYGSPISCRSEGKTLSRTTTSSSRSSLSQEADLLKVEEDGNESPAASVATSVGEESGRVADLNSRMEEDITLHFKNTGVETEIKIEGPDQLMLLTDITLALNEANVSVQGAKISTLNNHVEDVFYVVDGQTRNFLDLDRQEHVKATILKRLSERRQMATVVTA